MKFLPLLSLQGAKCMLNLDEALRNTELKNNIDECNEMKRINGYAKHISKRLKEW
jgi:hypothetical protein